jgi:hypothetical protein
LTLPAQAHPQRTLPNFVRHSEQQVRMLRTNAGLTEPDTFAEDCTPTRSCCVTPLSPLGLARRDALTDWFVKERRARGMCRGVREDRRFDALYRPGDPRTASGQPGSHRESQ